MTYPSKSASSPATEVPLPTETVYSNFVGNLVMLLCALICVLGLLAVSRCAWLGRLSCGPGSQSTANKGLKKKVLLSLPNLTYSADLAAKLACCPICLSELVAGDEIKMLPQCGHGFHVLCVDTWLGSHSSCPSCRQIVAVSRYESCGSKPEETSPAARAPVLERIIEGRAAFNTFLP